MADEKIYIGSGKERKFDNGGSVINCSICLDDLKKYHEQFGSTSEKGRHFLNIKIVQKKQIDQYGKSHSVEVDTYKPEKKQDEF
jgi:hypothetical protein